MLDLFCSLMLATAQPADALLEVNSGVRVVSVERTVQPSTVDLILSLPAIGAVLSGNPVWIQFRLDNYPLQTASQFRRSQEVAVNPMGQTVHVILDNDPYFPINEPSINPFQDYGFYGDQSYKFEVPFSLKEGLHFIRMFPCRSYGESLKGGKTMAVGVFSIGPQRKNPGVDLAAPYMTYNEPSDSMYLTEGKPVLVDFLLSNCELSEDGYKVQLSIDGKKERNLTSWQPYYLYGLKKGMHTIEMELLDESGKRVPGLFNYNRRKITIH